MLPRVLLLSLCLSAAALAGPVEDEFEEWMNTFGKKYQGDEKVKRLDIFRKNRDFVNSENAKGHSYTLGLNEFADLEADEFAKTHFGIAKPKKMWGDVPYLGTHKLSGKTAPSSVDWTTKGAVTPVKNQGQCGSCWSFSTTGSLEGAFEIATGNLVSLSEQQFVDCDHVDSGCNGGLMDNAFKFAEKNAICTDESYPYEAKASGTCKASSCTVGLPKGAVTGFKDVTSQDTDALMDALAQQPVSIAIEADQSAFQLYKTGVLTGTCGTKLDHGVLAVGYGTLNGQDYWKVKNSWGSTWGMEGYVLLEKGQSGGGECGIKMQPSYPEVQGSPGPSPPAPPTPPSPPSPPTPPTPGSSHYEKPPCRSDEQAITIEGIDGYSVCSPKCQDGSCPTDEPAGALLPPKCMLQDTSGDKYCTIPCLLGGCPAGGSCKRPSGSLLGLCMYAGDQSFTEKSANFTKGVENIVKTVGLNEPAALMV